MVASGVLRVGILVNHLVNWLTPYKDRTTIVTGERGALVADTAMGDLTFYENGHAPLQWDAIAAFRGVSEGQVVRYASPSPSNTSASATRSSAWEASTSPWTRPWITSASSRLSSPRQPPVARSTCRARRYLVTSA